MTMNYTKYSPTVSDKMKMNSNDTAATGDYASAAQAQQAGTINLSPTEHRTQP